MPRPNVVLVGFMGTGKSAVGRALARRLRSRLLDTDAWIEREAGVSIPQIFEFGGEEVFRDYETQAARHVSQPRGLVVSTGGGILGRAENRELLRKGGVVVCLTARPDVILERTAPWDRRPMLRTAPTPREAVERLLKERAPLYAEADWSIDTSDFTVDQVAERICAELPSLYPIVNTRS
jgi:shikimate kinase